ncbi:paired amphipathic helix protein Sin3-like 4 isoform X2 [Primulina eburnea]|uniref:paired amphipathic helix protein Sin3-like 4 isoform X2 n=1 Tax=Primulina eburnea TaxID=1245227 RepID=UPI003C6C31A0
MKRSREDVIMNSQHKRPVISSRVPPSGQVQMVTPSSTQRLTTNDALTYLKAVKDIFQDNRDKYEDFLDIMKDFKAQRVGTTGVILRVKELFKGHRHLILGFNAFLPVGYEITLPVEDEPLPKKKPVEFDEAINFVNRIKTRFQGDDHVYKAFLDILNMYRKDNKSITEVYQEVSVLFWGHADLLVEFTHFLPDTSGDASVHFAQSDRDYILPRDDRGSPMTMARSSLVDKPALSHDVDDQNVDHTDSDQWNWIEKVEKKEDGDQNEWEREDNFNHKRKSARKDDSVTDQVYQGMQELVSSFCEKVKERLQDPNNYEKFSDCVRSYKRKFITSSQFRILVASLLGTHTDLMEECEDFIIYVEKTGSLWNNKTIVRSLKVEDRDACDHDGEGMDKSKDRDIRESDRYDRSIAFNPKDVSGHRMSLHASKDKLMAKSIHELDLTDCESCTLSYRLLPQNYPISLASHRTEIGAKVLNDRWVSVTSGSEDYSFKHMRKNQYEESLFRCEDDRFELDMLLESVNATTKQVEELLDSINVNTSMTDSSFRVEDHLTALNLRCIERLYGDHGLDVMDVLRKNALLSLPVILTRLKQKQEEWARCRSEFNKVWAEIYAKNYHKSLDHRSFYFKQQDTKNLSAKALLAEIKEISEKYQNEGDMLLSIGAGYRQSKQPHMEFKYSDHEIHEDLYQLMKYSCGEFFTSEQHDKIMTIWTTFLEPMLGVPARPHSSDSEDVKHINYVAEDVANIGVEVNASPLGKATSGNCKSVDLLKNGDKNIPTEQPSSSKEQMGNGGDGVNIDGSYHKSDVCMASKNAAMQTDRSIMSVASGSSKQAGVFEQRASAESGINEENTSNRQNGPDVANSDYPIVAMLSEESQDDGSTRPASSSIKVVYEDVKAQNCKEETEGTAKNEREEGELSPTRDLDQNNLAPFGNIGTEAAQTPFISAGSTKRTEEEKCKEDAEETEANADDGDEMSTKGSSDGENLSENVDASESESADGVECSPEEPDEDGEHNENDSKIESDGDVGGAVNAHDTEGLTVFTDRFSQNAKPLTMKIPVGLLGKAKNSEFFYGNDSFYLLFRLHQMLYERMHSAKLHSLSPENKWRIASDANPTNSYARFKDSLHSLLNGSSDNTKFEDDCRAIIGTQSYILFTVDKLIHKLVKQTIATEEMENKLLHLCAYERSRDPEKVSDAIYHENACFLIPEDNLYRIECLASPRRLTIQLMKNENDKLEVNAVSMDPSFVAYLNDVLLSVPPDRKEKPGVFLKRNKRKCTIGDEICDVQKSMEELVIYNGLESKVVCSTLKAAYVLDTEDFLYRTGKRRKISNQNGSCTDAVNGASNGVSNGASNGYSHRVNRLRKLMFS